MKQLTSRRHHLEFRKATGLVDVIKRSAELAIVFCILIQGWIVLNGLISHSPVGEGTFRQPSALQANAALCLIGFLIAWWRGTDLSKQLQAITQQKNALQQQLAPDQITLDKITSDKTALNSESELTSTNSVNHHQTVIELQQSQARLHKVLNRASAVIASFRMWENKDWEYEYWSTGSELVYGYTQAEFLADKHLWISRVHPDDRETIIAPLFADIFAERSITIEYRFYHKDGSIRWISSTYTSQRNDAENCWMITVVDIDITDRKQFENALAGSQHFLEKLVNTVPQILYLFDIQKGTSLYLNQRSTEILGFTPEEICNASFQWLNEHFHPDDHYLFENLQDRFDHMTDHQILSTEYQFLHKDSEWRWLNTREAVFARNPEGKPIQVLGSVTDITDRKQIESALRESETRFRTLIENLNVGVLLQEVGIDRLHSNPKALELLDLTKAQLQGNAPLNSNWRLIREDGSPFPLTTLTVFQALVSHAMTPPAMPSITPSITDPPIRSVVLGACRVSATMEIPEEETIVWLLVNAEPQRTNDGTVHSIICTLSDITALKRTEDALRHSEARFQRLVANTPGVIFRYMRRANGSNEVLYMSPGSRELYELEPDAVQHDVRLIWRLIHPNDQRNLQRAIATSAKTLDALRWEGYITTPSGQQKWVQAILRPERQANGDVLWDGLAIDVSDRKQVEKLLQQQIQREQALNYVIQAIRSSLDLKTIFATAIAEIGRLLGADVAVITQYLPDRSIWLVVSEYLRSSEFSSILGMEIQDEGNPLAARLKRIELVRLDSISTMNNPMNQRLAQQCPGTWLMIPLHRQSVVWGSLSLFKYEDPYAWEGSDIELARIITDQLTIAVQQSELYQQLQSANQQLEHLANHDKLTQLANRRYFDDYLHQEWLRASRDKAPMAVILCDIDYFKQYNDAYGHPAGDECLVRVTQAISHVVKRPADLVARYGGEEFAVILPHTTQEGAIQVVQELREAIDRLQIPHRASPVKAQITLSYGIASTVPNVNSSPQNLIDRADRALYRAKAEGRNCYRCQ